ncbi:MAG: flagellar biosynthesis anti-sigma factor FlgM [Bacillota bacterium]|nr:flagellar biosynthesis anti-sigma factor FlgM [Bacillota bacterium]
MDVNRIGASKAIDLYTVKKKGQVEMKKAAGSSDSLQISSLGKSLSSMSIDNVKISADEKVEKIKAQIANGTYKKDAKLVAQKLYDSMKGRED